MTEQIAIAFAENPDRVSLWCFITKIEPDGTIHFEVINGRWFGQFRNGACYMGEDDWFPAEIVWRGRAPFHGYDYNEAIAWIEKQISKTTDDESVYFGA